MIFVRFFRHIREGFLGVKRHFGMSISSASAVTMTLLLVGFFLVLSVNLAVLTQDIENNISLSALVDYSVTSDIDLKTMKVKIESIDGVGDVTFSSKEDEFNYFVSQYKDEEIIQFYELYRDDNPFHDAFLVTISDTSKIESVKEQLQAISGISSVYDGGSNTYILIDVLNNARIFGGALVLGLCLLAVYLIYNTIKITIASRSTEIWIMRNVGAKNSYIRSPFLVEGIIIGVLGSIVPIGVICGAYYYILNITGGNLFGIIDLLPFSPLHWHLGLSLLGLGVIVGYLGSFISVTKYLRQRR